ncbi:hypothetical protein [Bacillus wiedmannii]|nr:hypothetical protein [Bacillus wiedmannii]MCU5331995.1 hypothetical protein [Bacillus wiedmannii]
MKERSRWEVDLDVLCVIQKRLFKKGGWKVNTIIITFGQGTEAWKICKK